MKTGEVTRGGINEDYHFVGDLDRERSIYTDIAQMPVTIPMSRMFCNYCQTGPTAGVIEADAPGGFLRSVPSTTLLAR